MKASRVLTGLAVALTVAGCHEPTQPISSSVKVPGIAAAPGVPYDELRVSVPIDLGTLPGASSSVGVDINDRGDVVGWAGFIASGQRHAVLWPAGGGIIDLGTLGGIWSYARGINNRGDVAGVSTTSTGAWRGFIWSGGVMRDMGPTCTVPPCPSGPFSSPEVRGINDLGQVTGYAQRPTGGALDVDAFVWKSGVYSFPSVPARRSGYAINNKGKVVGRADGCLDPRGWRGSGFVWRGDSYECLPALGPDQDFGDAFAINTPGDIVGSAYRVSTSLSDGRAYFYDRGSRTIRDLGTLGGRGSTAFDVNDGRVVVGHSETFAGKNLGFAWAPGTVGGMKILPALGGVAGSSSARAVNNLNQVVGGSTTASGRSHATLWTVYRVRVE